MTGPRSQDAIDNVRAAYDEAPYESYAHPLSAPGQLAAIAWVFGLDPPDVGTARDIADQGVIRIDRDDGQVLDDGDIRDVLTQQVDGLRQRLSDMKLASVCDRPSIEDRRRA